MTGCRPAEEEPLPPSPPRQVMETAIMAGQVGGDLVVQDYGASGYWLRAGYPLANTFSYTIDAAQGFQLQFSAYAHSTAYISTASADVWPVEGGQVGTIEIPRSTFLDSIFYCDQLPNFVQEYSLLSGYVCAGADSFLAVDSIRHAIAFAFGDSIDGNLPWRAGRAEFGWTYGGTIPSNYPHYLDYDFDIWARASQYGPRYMPFRWRSGAIWKYGYVYLRAHADELTIYQIVHQQP